MIKKKRRQVIRKFDPDYRFLLDLDPALEGWRAWAAEYNRTLPPFNANNQTALSAFLVVYLHGQGLHMIPPEEFCARGRRLPELDKALGLDLMAGESNIKKKHDTVSDFLEWVLNEKLSVLDAGGNRIVPSHLANPFPRRMIKRYGKESDLSFDHVLKLDPQLEDWRNLAAEWLKDQRRAVPARRDAIAKFLTIYIHGQNLERNFGRFLMRETQKPKFDEVLVEAKQTGEMTLSANGIMRNNYAKEFIDWVLTTKLSDPDTGDWDRSRFHNPISRPTYSGQPARAESDKKSLSIRYIRELRSMLAEGPNFRDWKWAQDAMTGGKSGGDWFVVDPKTIDPTDPDCMFRRRAAGKHQRKSRGYSAEVWEIWSPVRAVALYLKLELPLRTFQVRMLDSGEADTWRYVHAQNGGGFVLNLSPLATGSEKRPLQRGVFHQSTNEREAGLYINTNKTADVNKSENQRGYVIPWAPDEVLYWLDKLRNWQERYNPVSEPTPWTSLERKHFGGTRPHPEVLAQRGSACFLFRDPIDGKGDKPLTDVALNRLWYHLLARLEQRCEKSISPEDKLHDGTPLRFVNPDSHAQTWFSLHSLRVSLISYFILDKKLPIALVSKMIAGHASIIMTLHYTKVGKAYLREVLREAEKNELEAEQANHRRFFQEASFEQVSQRFAFVSEDAVRAVIGTRSVAALAFDDKGICPNGATLCDVGGESLADSRNEQQYAPVPGFPQERNCVCCRFLLTGPAFLPGLIAHFNTVSEKVHRQSGRYNALDQKLRSLEDGQRKAEREDQPFLRVRELEQLSKYAEGEALILNKFINDLQSTNHLIQRSIQIAGDKTNGGVKLVAKGSMADLKVSFIESQSVLHLFEVVCENAVIYPDIDAGFATVRRAQMLDAMLRYNDMEPVLMNLTQEQQLLVGNAVMQLIQARTGSIEGALPYAECRAKLKTIGLLKDEVLSEIAQVKARELIDHAKTKRALSLPKEAPHDDAS